MSQLNPGDRWGTSFAAIHRPSPRLSAADITLLVVGVIAVVSTIVLVALTGVSL